MTLSYRPIGWTGAYRNRRHKWWAERGGDRPGASAWWPPALAASKLAPVRAARAEAAFLWPLALAASMLLPAGMAWADAVLLWSFQANGSLESMAAVPDVDGDGTPDVVIEGYGNGPSGVDHVFALRGASTGTAEVLWSARPLGGVSNGGGDGDNCLRLGPDLSGDGVPELLLGTAWGGRTAFALSGRDGETFWGFDTYLQSESGWVYAMDDLGSDLTGDGIHEIVASCGSYNDHIYCLNGATGAMVWSYFGRDASLEIRSCADLDGDGIRDVVAGLGDDAVPRQVIALRGSNGTLLWSRQVNGSVWNLDFVSDITGDGVAEIVPALWTGTLYCLSGSTGAVAWSVAAPNQQRVAALDDVNGDGLRDVLVGLNTTAGIRCYSGADGALLWTAATGDWVWAVDRIADCTGDGINDAIGGDFDGTAYLINGASGAVVWSWTNPTRDKILTIRGGPDLNGNGWPDVIAGTQLLTNGTGGDVYALEGNSDPTALPPGAGAQVPRELTVSAARPNPSSGAVAWDIQGLALSTGSARGFAEARFVILGPDGGRVADLRSALPGAGSNATLTWDGRDAQGRQIGSGVYHLAVLRGEGVEPLRKFVRVR